MTLNTTNLGATTPLPKVGVPSYSSSGPAQKPLRALCAAAHVERQLPCQKGDRDASLVVTLIGILFSVTALAQAEPNRTVETQPPISPRYKLKPDVSLLRWREKRLTTSVNERPGRLRLLAAAAHVEGLAASELRWLVDLPSTSFDNNLANLNHWGQVCVVWNVAHDLLGMRPKASLKRLD